MTLFGRILSSECVQCSAGSRRRPLSSNMFMLYCAPWMLFFDRVSNVYFFCLSQYYYLFCLLHCIIIFFSTPISWLGGMEWNSRMSHATTLDREHVSANSEIGLYRPRLGECKTSTRVVEQLQHSPRAASLGVPSHALCFVTERSLLSCVA